jgi:hypothetical protein
MTEPPIVPPPNWKPAPGARETMAAGIVRQFKENLWNAKELIRFWAGRNDKPNLARNAARQHITAVLGALDQLQDMHRLQAGRVQEFRAFGQVWNDGNGSWTQCKPLILALNDAMMDLQP